MQENNKIEFSKGIVKQAGYPEVTCKIIKAGVNRKDDMSDKPLYVVENIPLKDGLYVVTPSISEALSRVERKTIGVMNEQGELLVPMNNSSIISISDKYIACNTYDSTKDLKADPLNFQQNINTSQEIKTQMKTLANTELTFKCDNFNAKYDLYEISEDNKFNKIFEGASYVALDNDVIYAHTNEVMDETFVYGKEETKEIEPSVPTNAFESLPIGSGRIIEDDKKVEMPVAAFATVQDKPLDNLEVAPNFTEVKPGAPTLIQDEELPKEETKPLETPVAVAEPEPVPAKPEIDTTSVEDEKEVKPEEKEEIELPKEEVKFESQSEENTEEVVEPETGFIAVEDKTPEIDTTPVEVEKEIKPEEKENKIIFSSESEPKEKMSDMADIAGLVSAVKGKIENSTKKIEEQEQAINDKDKEIEDLKEQLEKLEKENNLQTKRIEVLITENQDLSSKTEKLEKTVEDVYSAFSGLIDNPEETTNYFRKVA